MRRLSVALIPGVLNNHTVPRFDLVEQDSGLFIDPCSTTRGTPPSKSPAPVSSMSHLLARRDARFIVVVAVDQFTRTNATLLITCRSP